MRSSSTCCTLGLACLLIVLCTGCPNGDEPAPVEPPPQAKSPEESSEKPEVAEKVEKPEPPPPPPTVPEVHLTDALRETCLVSVGDAMPTAELAGLNGDARPLGELFGEKLTVILFWNRGDSLYSQMAATSTLEDLQKDVAEPYGEKGVAVVGVNVGDPPEEAKQHVEEAGAAFPNLSDPDGDFFAKVATANLPRVYLLDAEGKIIWFDLEYSQITRRNLLQAIQVELGEI